VDHGNNLRRPARVRPFAPYASVLLLSSHTVVAAFSASDM
jgi:hypothetical protein